MTQSRQPHALTRPARADGAVHAWAGGAAAAANGRLWFEAWAPLGTDDIAWLEDRLAVAEAGVVLDLRGAGPHGVGLAVADRIMAWGARPRPFAPVHLMAADGPAAAIVGGIRLRLAQHGDAATVASRPDGGLDAAFAGFRDAHAETLAARRSALACWTATRWACLAEPSAELAAIADRVGLASRQLQRRLAELGTSVRSEQRRARMELAYERVVGGQAKLLSIAREVGFASESQLSRAFRMHFGASPAALRARRA